MTGRMNELDEWINERDAQINRNDWNEEKR